MAIEGGPQSKKEELEKKRDALRNAVGVFETEKKIFADEAGEIEKQIQKLQAQKSSLLKRMVDYDEEKEGAEKKLKEVEAELASFKI